MQDEITPIAIPPSPSGWLPIPITLGSPLEEIGEFASSELVWDYFHLLIAKTVPIKNKRFSSASVKDFKQYIRQAETYWRAAESVKGIESALLYYYCFMNLAKAELIRENYKFMQNKVLHGLSSKSLEYENEVIKIEQIKKAKDIKSGEIFPLFAHLYNQRLGKNFQGVISDLPVRELISRIPELGLESQKIGLASKVCNVFHAITIEQGEAKSEFLLFNPHPLMSDSVTWSSLTKLYTQEPVYQNWRNVFSLSARTHPSGIVLLKSIKTVDIKKPGIPDAFIHDLGAEAFMTDLSDVLGGLIEVPDSSAFDGLILPSLSDKKQLPLTSGLARYAMYFYLSSLVRYRPSMLDPNIYPEQVWLLEAFNRQSALPLLQDFYRQISGNPLRFFSPRV